MRKFSSTLVLAAAGAALLAPVNVAAQGYSQGYTFLKAVRDRDGNAVTEALNQPGNVIVNARDISNGESALHIVTQRRDLSWIRFLTAKGANPNVEDKKGNTPLQLAANLGFADGVEALVKAGARVDVTNSAGETPLIAAVHRRDADTVRLLLANGASVDKRDNSGRSARDYVGLMSGNTQLLEIIDGSEKARQAGGQNYGPVIR